MAEDFSKPYCGDFVKYTIDEHLGQIVDYWCQFFFR